MKIKRYFESYIWQKSEWPHFRWDNSALMQSLAEFSSAHGLLMGKMSMLGFEKKSHSMLNTLCDEIISSSIIEGIAVNPQSLRSSLARKLGIKDDGIIFIEDRYTDGLAEIMVDAIDHCHEFLSTDRLFDWHAALFPTGRSGMYKILVGDWRKGEEPMQVVSGALGHEKVHYEAPPSDTVPQMMDELIDWYNRMEYSPAIMAGIVHLWFVSIHPFDDGNGRIARILTEMTLSRLDGGAGRYYSISAEINRHKKDYYEMLELAQKGGMDITRWLDWFIRMLKRAIEHSDNQLANTLRKADFWDRNRNIIINERQRKILNMLFDDFEGKLTTSKWAKICKCSQDTALRDIKDLISKKILNESEAGGRSINYHLVTDSD